MSYKSITQKSYEDTAEIFARNVEELVPMQSIEKFMQLLPLHAKIIDIGCGSGRDAKIFTEKGISVLGIDVCENLLNIAKVKAPLAEFRHMDMEALFFPAASFDGAWAGCSLLHLPKKIFPSVLNTIHSILKEQGSLYLTLKKGVGEGIEKDMRYGDFEKFWSYYDENEIKEVLSTARFKILELQIVEKQFAYQSHPAIRVFCQKI